MPRSGGGALSRPRAPTGVNTDPKLQPDEKLRALDSQPSQGGAREEVYCTKVGTTHPEEMYIVGAHMDGHGWGEAANDDGSGTALVMELARVFRRPTSAPIARSASCSGTTRRLASTARGPTSPSAQALQGKEDPPGSGQYPEPKWLGMIQHDMMMFDHGMPRADGTMSARSSGPRPT